MDVIQSLWQVIEAFAGLLLSILALLAPWTPLLLWIAFWLYAVNWRKLYPLLMQGGLIGVLLIAFLAILVWSSIAVPTGDGMHHVYGLKVSNLVGKTVYVSSLLVIAFLCGTVQLSGTCGRLCRFEDAAPAVVHREHAHH